MGGQPGQKQIQYRKKEVRGGKFSELFHAVLHEASPKKIRQDLGLDNDETK